MTTTHQVTCIRKSDRSDPHERIREIGGKNSDGTRWKLTQAQAIADIESRKYSFYTIVGTKRADVIVAVSQNGHKYLRTTADDTKTNNLLSLPECPA
jgi:hypothetical protein